MESIVSISKARFCLKEWMHEKNIWCWNGNWCPTHNARVQSNTATKKLFRRRECQINIHFNSIWSVFIVIFTEHRKSFINDERQRITIFTDVNHFWTGWNWILLPQVAISAICWKDKEVDSLWSRIAVYASSFVPRSFHLLLRFCVFAYNELSSNMKNLKDLTIFGKNVLDY